jgi:hypothetical protein
VTSDENYANLKDLRDFHIKVSKLIDAVEREIFSHPDYLVGTYSIDSKGMYVVLERESDGVKHSIDLEVKFNQRIPSRNN